jgi:hypothetical protein
MNVASAAAAAEAVGPVLDKLGGPKGVIGRAIGMGQQEIQAGIPKWAWFGVGLMVGAGAMWACRGKITKVFGH